MNKLTFNKGVKAIQLEKGQFFHRIILEQSGIHMCKNMQLGPYLTLYPQINLKCIRDIDLRAKKIFLKKIKEKSFDNLG